MDALKRFTPAVDKRWLILIAGGFWFGVGIMLCRLAYGWLMEIDTLSACLFAITGVSLAFLIYRFGFSKLAFKNIKRINAYLQQKVCIFAFQRWTSYPLIVVMIAIGIGLRKYSSLPKPYLAVLYTGIGGGLLFSSLHYFISLRRMRRTAFSLMEEQVDSFS